MGYFLLLTNKILCTVLFEERSTLTLRKIVLDLQSGLFADAISQVLEGGEPDFITIPAESPQKTVTICKTCHAYAAIMEVTPFSPWKLEERLKLGEAIKQTAPECKVLLLVDEMSNKSLATAVTQAKKDELIDNFIYASVSPTYLIAILDAL